MRKHAVAIVLALLLAAGLAGAAAASDPPPVDARAVLVADGRTGEILYERNADRSMAMASITKLMTALVTLENARPGAMVTVAPQAVSPGGSSIFLTAGERLRVRDLLAAALIQSANDSAFALAAEVGNGSVKRFVRMMNAKAEELGLDGTNYVRPDGLDVPGHVSTARDTFVLARAAMRQPLVRELVRKQTAQIPPGPGAQDLERPPRGVPRADRGQDRAHRQRRLGAGGRRAPRADHDLRRHAREPLAGEAERRARRS